MELSSVPLIPRAVMLGRIPRSTKDNDPPKRIDEEVDLLGESRLPEPARPSGICQTVTVVHSGGGTRPPLRVERARMPQVGSGWLKGRGARQPAFKSRLGDGCRRSRATPLLGGVDPTLDLER